MTTRAIIQVFDVETMLSIYIGDDSTIVEYVDYHAKMSSNLPVVVKKLKTITKYLDKQEAKPGYLMGCYDGLVTLLIGE